MLAQMTGDLIRRRRAEKRLSQAEVARMAGVSRTVLSRLERGTATAVQTDVLDRLFAALEIRPVLDEDPLAARRRARLEQQLRVEKNRTRHLQLALRLAGDGHAARPLIAQARARVQLWHRHQSCSEFYIERWSEVLRLPSRQLAARMALFGDWEDAMFQNTPWSWVWISPA